MEQIFLTHNKGEIHIKGIVIFIVKQWEILSDLKQELNMK
jgi:hypothetical protein